MLWQGSCSTQVCLEKGRRYYDDFDPKRQHSAQTGSPAQTSTAGSRLHPSPAGQSHSHALRQRIRRRADYSANPAPQLAASLPSPFGYGEVLVVESLY